MPVLTNIGELCTCRDEGGQGELHALRAAALVWHDERIVWVGEQRALPAQYRSLAHYDAGERLVVPGFVDCHTHLVFAGERSEEFVRRIRGESYLDIARAGGGIAETMRATRAASQPELMDLALSALREMAALGVTTAEVKSGYGLTLAAELKLLEVVAALGKAQPVELVPTLLAAHIVPPEYREQRGAYVELVTRTLIPEVAARGLARFCDVFVEEGAFTADEARTILGAARAHGLLLKLHVDQLTAGAGAELAAELGATSADHLEHTTSAGLTALAQHGVVAVALPIASLYTFERALDARRLVQHGVRVAVATDYNPGSAPSYHLPLALLLACTLCRLTPHEALKAVTIEAARALSLNERIGSLEPGKQADFALLDAPSANAFVYRFRPTLALATVKRGELIHGELPRTDP